MLGRSAVATNPTKTATMATPAYGSNNQSSLVVSGALDYFLLVVYCCVADTVQLS